MAKVGHDLDSCTSTVEDFVLHHHKCNVVFVDTPGFNHPSKTDGVVLKEIIDWLKEKSVLSRILSYILIFRQIPPRHTFRRYYLPA